MKNIIKRFSIIAAVALVAMTPAVAQTTVHIPANEISIPSEYKNVFGDPNKFVSETTGVRTQKNPDVVTNVTTANKTSESDSPVSGSRLWNEKCQTISTVNADCTPLSLNPGSGGFYTTTAVVTSGGESVIKTCTTNTITFDGYDPATSLFAITSDSSTKDC